MLASGVPEHLAMLMLVQGQWSLAMVNGQRANLVQWAPAMERATLVLLQV